MLTREELEVMLKMALDTIKAREATIQVLISKLQSPQEDGEEKPLKMHVFNDGVATKPL